MSDDKWKQFGIELKVDNTALNNIGSRSNKAGDRYIAVYEEWSKSLCTPYTWETILNALRALNEMTIYHNLLKCLHDNGHLNIT